MPGIPILLVLALAVYCIGAAEFMLAPMLTPLAAAFGTTPQGASWLVAAHALAIAVAAPLLGRLGDRIGRRRLLLPALLLFATVSAALPLAPSLAPSLASSLAPALVLRVAGGVASAALIPTIFALLADLVPAPRRSQAMGRVMLGMTLGIATGPALAGLLTEAFGWRAPFLAVAALSLLVLAAAHTVLPAGTTGTTEAAERAIPAPRRRRVDAALALPLAAKALWLGAGIACFLLSGEVLRARYGLDTLAVGLAASLFGLGLGAGNLAVGRVDRLLGGPEGSLAGAVLAKLAALVLFLSAPLPLAAALACIGLLGIGTGLAAPASTAILAGRAGSHAGFALALSEAINNAGVTALLPLAAGLLAAGRTDRMAALLGGLLAVAALLSLADARRAQRQRPKPPMSRWK